MAPARNGQRSTPARNRSCRVAARRGAARMRRAHPAPNVPRSSALSRRQAAGQHGRANAAEAARHRCPGIRSNDSTRRLGARADGHRHRVQRVHPVLAVLGVPVGPGLRRRLRGRRLPLAVLLAAHRRRRPAGLVLPGDPHPVDPARLPDHLLLLPQGVLPVLLRRSAGVRRRRAHGPPALRHGGGLPVHPPEPPPDLPVPRVRARCSSCGWTRSWRSARPTAPSASGWAT